MPTMRKIHFDEGEVWEYCVGRTGNVIIKSPEGFRHNIPAHKVKGTTDDIYGRGQWKRTSDGMLTPSEVKKFIKGNLS